MDSLATKFKKPVLVIAVLLCFGLLIAEWQLQFVRTAPRIDRNTLVSRPNLQLLLQPQKAPDFIQAIAEQQTGRSIPGWLIKRVLPYEMGMLFYEDKDSPDIQLHSYTSMPHLAKAAYRVLQSTELSTIDSNIQWQSPTVQWPETGVLTAQGSVEADAVTSDAVFYQWGEARPLTTLPLSGNHFGEMVFDNRAGQAYLTMVSFMKAHGLDFGEDHSKILASFQFVISIRANVNVTANNQLKVYLGIEIQPEHKNKLGVGTLHGGIQEIFAELGKTLESKHGIKLSGGSEWNENVIEFNYLIENATQVATLLAARQLF